VVGSRIVLDGPRDAILEKLGAGNRTLASPTPQTNPSHEVTA